MLLNQRVAKASSPVTVNDTLDICIGPRRKTLTILEVPTGQVSKKASSSLYQLTGEFNIPDPMELPGPIDKGAGGY